MTSNDTIIGGGGAVHYAQEAKQQMISDGAVSSCDFHIVNKS